MNRALYRLAWVARGLPLLAASRLLAASFRAPGAGGSGRVLLLAWGRLGDTLLAGPLNQSLAGLFPGAELLVLGRPEVAPLLGPLAARFLPFTERLWLGSPRWRGELRRALAGGFEAVVGDLHLFHGGLFTAGPLLAALPARRRYHYDGHAPRRLLAPWRPLPRGVAVVPAPGEEPGSRHLWLHARRYVAAILADLGRAGEAAGILAGVRPGRELAGLAAPLPPGVVAGEYIAVQPASNQPKKDWPGARWRELLASFPEERFLLLGSRPRRPDGLGLPRVLDLRGRTTLAEAAALLRGARLFVGPDSGLAHMAALLGRPALCVAQGASLGWFHPYPPELGCPGPRLVTHPGFAECAGCLAVCTREPLWRQRRRGSVCLREIPAGAVAAAVRELLPG